MVGEWITGGIIVFALIRMIVSMINAYSQLNLGKGKPEQEALISILIPARNEAENLPVLLEGLTNQEYSNLEILVYDDHSEDHTASVTRLYEKRDSRVRLIQHENLPAGWLGKNFACHKLAQEAKGTYYLFLDADVRVSSDMTQNALAFMEKQNLDLLSIFPCQLMKYRGEWLTVPLMNWILLSLLPLILVRKSRKPSLAAANGQFMLFRASCYNRFHWHEQVKDHLVEDITIIRKMKSMGYKTATMLGRRDVACRMYISYTEAVNGFAKNIIEYFGGNSVLAIVFVLLILSGIIIPFTGNFFLFLIYVFLVLSIRFFTSYTSGQSPARNVLFHIPQMLTFVFIVFKGLKVKWSGKYKWKGRVIG